MKKLFASILVFVLICAAMPPAAEANTVIPSGGDDYYETDKNGTLMAKKNIAWPEEIVIPYTDDGVTVEKIGYAAFSNRYGIEVIYIPDTVEEISDNAFFGCKDLEMIFIPASVTAIGPSALERCKELEAVYYGGSAETWRSFEVFVNDSCTIYCGVNFEGSVLAAPEEVKKPDDTVIDQNWFDTDKKGSLMAARGVDWPEIVVIPDFDDGVVVEKIDYAAFSNRYGIEQIYVPASVEAIGDNAFYGCKDLEMIFIPASVTFIGPSAFERCKELEAVYYGGSAETWRSFEVFVNDKCTVYCEAW